MQHTLATIGRDFARTRSFLRELYWENLVQRALQCWNLTAPDESVMNALLFDARVKGHLPMSNMHVRCAAREALLDAVLQFAAENEDQPLYLITFAWDIGNTWLNRPFVDLVAMRGAIDAMLRREGLTGLLGFEFDCFLPQYGDVDYPLRFHAHGIVWPVAGGTVKVREFNKRYRRTRGFKNAWGAAAIKIEKINASDWDRATVGSYMVDPPHQLKKRVPIANAPGKFRTRSTRARLVPSIVLRLTEIQSYISVYDAYFAVGAVGVELRRRWKIRMTAWEKRKRGRSTPPVGETDINLFLFWNRLRRSFGAKRYLPCRIITRSNRQHMAAR